MINATFRPAGSLKEFYEELETIKANKSKVLFWQKDSETERSKHYGIMKSYIANKVKTSINIQPDKREKFEKDKDIFIYVEELGILFKGSYETYVNNTLKVTVDDKVLLKEKRISSRMSFNYTKVNVDILLEGKVPLNNLKLKDVSENGIGFICKDKLARGLITGIEVHLTGINGIEFPQAIMGKIIHRSKASKTNKIPSGTVQAGVVFHQPSKLLKKVMETFNSED